IDKCIDCGFCESVCPSKNLTLTPRQRITVWREINKLKISNDSNEIVKSLEKAYKYYGEQTCATDGLCELSCPVDIDTGKLIKHIRNNEQTKTEKTIANWIANHFSFVTSSARISLSFVGFISKIIGANFLENLLSKLHSISKNKIPLWNKAIPLGAKFTSVNKIDNQLEKTVVYFPSCISRTFGKKTNSNYAEEQHSVMERLFKKAGYNVIYPENVNSLCCGMAFSSKGFFDEAKIKHDELYKNLLSASNNGQHKIIFDTSPCVKTIKDNLQKANDDKLQIYDSIEFIHDYLLNELNFTQKEEPITVHSTCSATKMDLQDKLISIAKKCSTKVFIPEDVNCCGFAGD
ncbi:MAG: (Fe-S)-binding protein, partial [Ignavibacteriae bacterium]|nr:(Fe-S)-binding protein [Ignavibacteriota bacterium]